MLQTLNGNTVFPFFYEMKNFEQSGGVCCTNYKITKWKNFFLRIVLLPKFHYKPEKCLLHKLRESPSFGGNLQYSYITNAFFFFLADMVTAGCQERT